ncbi:MAG TPA: FlgD immunoglobulin-like domain containing protein, partial [Candidatus Polarisedimenticolia bacterium]|nr:FlgD immunoglobulin-like domain containing protein [Candidatus Polarisedimenticolia bacterium]
VVVHDPSSPSGSGGDHGSSIPVTLRAGPTPSAGAVRFSLRGRPGSEGQAAVHDVQGRLVARWRVAVPGSGVADWSWSAKVAGGQALPSGLYFLSLEIDGAQLKRRLVISH